MLKIDLYDPESGETMHYEQPRTSMGDMRSVLSFDEKQQKNDAKKRILDMKLKNGTLTAKEEKEYVSLFGTDGEQLKDMEDIVVKLFHNPKVTTKSIDEGLEANGASVLGKIIQDAAGGAQADANHPAKK